MSGMISSFAVNFASVFCLMAPWLLFGFLAAGVLSELISPETVKKHLGGESFGSIIRAAVFGVPLPLCSCGVIPVALSMRKNGAGKGAVTSFLISTPQTGVDSIIVTWSMLGWVFAVFRPVAAFISGVFGGVLTQLFSGGEKKCRCCHEESGHESHCREVPSAESQPPNGKTLANRVRDVFHYSFVILVSDIAWALVFGAAVSAVISTAVPDNWFAVTIGSGIMTMLLMILLGIPLYVCATASVPIAAALIDKGVSPGAALVFLMTGPATNSAAIIAVWKMLGGRSAAAYLLSIVISSLVCGYLLDFIISLAGLTGQTPVTPLCAEHGSPGAVDVVSGVILAALILLCLARNIKSRLKPSEDSSCCHS
jgi:uncharacterized membrane protein YraQ (UPF0718 family)